MKNFNLIKDEISANYAELNTNEGMYIHLFGPVRFPVSTDGINTYEYQWYVWIKTEDHMSFEQLLSELRDEKSYKNYDSILTYGDFASADKVLVRVHSCCFTGDVAFSTRCDCGQQLKASFEKIIESGTGAIGYLANQEGRGIGLFAKAITYKIQDNYDIDTFTSCNVIDFEEESRRFNDLGEIFNFLRKDKGITLLSNNPEKINGLIESGLNILEVEPLNGFENKDSIKGLNQKKIRASKIKCKFV